MGSTFNLYLESDPSSSPLPVPLVHTIVSPLDYCVSPPPSPNPLVQLLISYQTLCDPMASLSVTNSQSLLKLMSIKSVMPSNHLILCHPLLLP